MMKKKILIMGADDMPAGVAGYANELVKLCDHSKYEFHITVSEVREAGSVIDPRVLRHLFPVTYSAFSLLPLVLRLRKLIIENSFHLLHLHTARAGLIGCLATVGLPVSVVYTGHSWRFQQKDSRPAIKLFYLLEKFICARSNVSTFSTTSDLNLGVSNKLIPGKKGVVISTRIEAGSFQNVPQERVSLLKSELGLPNDACVVGTIGYMSSRKDPITFVKIASKVVAKKPDSYFLWVGDGELKEEALALAKDLGISDKFIVTGVVQPTQIPEFLKVMDLFLFTSHNEGVPLSVMAAQASGLLVICSRYGGSGVEELVVDGETGLLFDIGDAQAASDLILGVVTDKKQHERLVSAMKRRFKICHADPDVFAKEFETVYDSLL